MKTRETRRIFGTHTWATHALVRTTKWFRIRNWPSRQKNLAPSRLLFRLSLAGFTWAGRFLILTQRHGDLCSTCRRTHQSPPTMHFNRWYTGVTRPRSLSSGHVGDTFAGSSWRSVDSCMEKQREEWPAGSACKTPTVFLCPRVVKHEVMVGLDAAGIWADCSPIELRHIRSVNFSNAVA
jgi:hypothetical protein